MMKRFLKTVMLFAVIAVLAGCGSVTQVAETTASAKQEKQTETKASKTTVDVDLTALSSTMVYSEVYNMLSTPDTYVGKKVRMSGQFNLFQATDESGAAIPDQIYYACVIADATACCQQGLEFVLSGNAVYPNDYPEIGDEITVVGEFRTYMEGDYQYCHLVNAKLES